MDKLKDWLSVFSTYVEVILALQKCKLKKPGFLHVCGGDPNNGNSYSWSEWFSPRKWGYIDTVKEGFTKSFIGAFFFSVKLPIKRLPLKLVK